MWNPIKTREDRETIHLRNLTGVILVDATSSGHWKSRGFAPNSVIPMNTHGMKVAVRGAALGTDLRDLAPMAQRWGFNGLQLDLKLGDLDLGELSATGQRDVRNTIARHDLELVSVRVALPHAGLADGDAGQMLWLVERA